MKVCGIEIKASEMRFAVLEGEKDSFTVRDTKPKKLQLCNDEKSEDVKDFRDSFFAFVRENKFDLIAIKKRGKKGEYAGGSVGFKLEGIAQLNEECPVELVSPQRISAQIKKFDIGADQSLNKYQHTAFYTAFACLP